MQYNTCRTVGLDMCSLHISWARPKRKNSERISAASWERVKPEFVSLYTDQGLKLDDVVAQLRKKPHGFNATYVVGDTAGLVIES